MTNVALLQEEIAKSGLGPVETAAIWGVSLPTYYKLKTGEGDFTAAMIMASTDAWKLTRDKRDAIFFAQERE